MMDIEKIEQLIKLAKDSTISELTLKRDGIALSIKKGAARSVSGKAVSGMVKAKAKERSKSPEAASGAVESKPLEGLVVPSPMVGIFHTIDGIASPGAVLKAGQAIGQIESMKLVNEITVPSDGVLQEVLVEDGMPVEYGQPLFVLSRD